MIGEHLFCISRLTIRGHRSILSLSSPDTKGTAMTSPPPSPPPSRQDSPASRRHQPSRTLSGASGCQRPAARHRVVIAPPVRKIRARPAPAWRCGPSPHRTAQVRGARRAIREGHRGRRSACVPGAGWRLDPTERLSARGAGPRRTSWPNCSAPWFDLRRIDAMAAPAPRRSHRRSLGAAARLRTGSGAASRAVGRPSWSQVSGRFDSAAVDRQPGTVARRPPPSTAARGRHLSHFLPAGRSVGRRLSLSSPDTRNRRQMTLAATGAPLPLQRHRADAVGR